MSFVLDHILASGPMNAIKVEDYDGSYYKIDEQGRLSTLYPGTITQAFVASFSHRVRDLRAESPDGTPASSHGNFQTSAEPINVVVRIFAPDGSEFAGTTITMEDIYRYRDLRGQQVGAWTYSIIGQSRKIVLNADGIIGENIFDPVAHFRIGVIEEVHSESAGALIAPTPLTSAPTQFKFDLFRVGTFIASVSHPPIFHSWQGTLRLLDPDGQVVAATTQTGMRVAVDLRMLDRSRDARGGVRLWSLEVIPGGGHVLGATRLSANVIATAKTTVSAIQSRLEALLGPHGSYIKLYGENKGGQAIARLMITDLVSAETLDMHDVLEAQLKKYRQDPPARADEVSANIVYTFAATGADVGYGMSIDVGNFALDTIDVTVGPGVKLGADTPTARLKIKTKGAVKVKLLGHSVGSAKLRDGELEIELGIRIDEHGVPRLVNWLPENPLDIDVDWIAILEISALTSPIVGLGVTGATELVESFINDKIISGALEFLGNPVIAASILMMLRGAHFTYRSARTDGTDIFFDYVAPVEPDPRLSEHYRGVIGRRYEQLGPQALRFTPVSLGDTWQNTNLKKIEHIVVVMMENRSYDHTLGYRAQAPINDGADGLTDTVIAAIETSSPSETLAVDPDIPGAPPFYEVRKLRNAAFPANAAGLKTRLPRGVGHELSDVAEQLAAPKIQASDQRWINSPKGFYDNFARKLSHGDPQGVVAKDVLGYYDGQDLSFYAYLAENYAYCDRYFCSHPGPTLPNRMFSLSGDVQYDRLGTPILGNNKDDNFLLSRALNIYDFLSRKGISWRVYESNPSLTMLRMYARYATDEVNIRPIATLKDDIGAGLAQFTVVDPAMHHHPQNDDHPDADMLRGQHFLQDVYQTLRSNPAVWEKTLLLITYDEHGGLYDHVIPPTADLLIQPLQATDGGSVPQGMHGNPSLPIGYGVRVPTFVVSPWVTAGKGPSITLDHCSILKTVLACFTGDQKPFFGERVDASQTFESFLTAPAARMDIPDPATVLTLPDDVRRVVDMGQSNIETDILTRRQMREGPVDYHVLTGRLARMLGR